ncbi:hypothetical protein [Schlesneria paludicola]|uniref:hypothetical protein n=1 Tax=Schlesneria paludicola TaxID=360056 RepID=UPI00029AA566|nr:hypothetical protein [Schlesneria paludicola]
MPELQEFFANINYYKICWNKETHVDPSEISLYVPPARTDQIKMISQHEQANPISRLIIHLNSIRQITTVSPVNFDDSAETISIVHLSIQRPSRSFGPLVERRVASKHGGFDACDEERVRDDLTWK